MSVAVAESPSGRVGLVVSILERERGAAAGPGTDEDRFTALMRGAALRDVWFALAVLDARLPDQARTVAVHRVLRLDGPRAAFRRWLRPTGRLSAPHLARRQVEVISGHVLVDLHHTSRTDLATGIQRVARCTAARWVSRADVRLVGWTLDGTALRALTGAERVTALHGGPPAATPASTRVLVPRDGVYLLPELATEPDRTARILALARFSGLRTGTIGFDCVPITSGDTVAPGMGAAFAGTLAAVREMDTVATISLAAATEYRGWRRMLAGTGLPGPRIEAVVLPVEAESTTTEAIDRVRGLLDPDGLPLVLCVGSHEPRKNHLAVLDAAETAWRAGRRFRLAFVGGNSWSAQEFDRQLDRLRNDGRPVTAVRAIDDADLWAAYRLAHVVVFPSLNEGFGLPVAEALASGTPVITSNFGSMREIADGGGALLVDPRDDSDLTAALNQMLGDPQVSAGLRAEAAARPPGRTWDQYADEVWQLLVAGR